MAQHSHCEVQEHDEDEQQYDAAQMAIITSVTFCDGARGSSNDGDQFESTR